jgi:hypothetical protein
LFSNKLKFLINMNRSIEVDGSIGPDGLGFMSFMVGIDELLGVLALLF